MANRKNQVVGLKTELTAQLRLAEDPNIIVFTPLGGLGPVDIVTLDLTTGEYKAYDVKSKNFRKKDYTGKDGYERKRKGSLIHRGTTNEQKKLNVKIIYE
ncbi:hypothetical protein N9I13_00305 [bacterium]|jgi:hypothetical protein|nr:hypothetical protein [bacterium]|tara:strand:+ start:310 stop:609 length:300 start_codon:yes stop_codon:yes gene_type:complete